MKHKILILFFALMITSSLFFGEYLTVQADDHVNDSVFDLYDKQADPDTEHSNQNNVQNSDTQRSVTDENSSTVGITAWDMIKTIFVLVFVIGLLVALLKWLQRKGNLSPALHIMKNLGGTNLGGNRSVQMIKTGNSIIIVGVGENVQLLKEITDKKEIELILEKHDKHMDQILQPKDFFSKIIRKWNEQKEHEKESISFKEEFNKQLDDIHEKRKEILKEQLEKGSKNQ